MDTRTLDALRGSIAKWERIVAGTDVDRQSANCPLCKLFIKPDPHSARPACGGCPVAKEVGVGGCQFTPYEEWNSHQWALHGTARKVGDCLKCALLAKAELDFLKTLLPRDAA